jgi:nitrogen fixation protein FixH
MSGDTRTREFTGRKMLIVTVGAFAVIIAVNLLLAFKAVSTFPGLEVEDSYIASQTFDAERKAQEALGWTSGLSYRDGMLHLTLTGRDGAAAAVKTLTATLGRPTERSDDLTPAFAFDGTAWTAPAELARGYWQLWLDVIAADGTAFHQRLDLKVAG